MEEVLKGLITELGKYEAEFRIISTDHLQELREDIELLRRDQSISEEFYIENLSFLRFEKPEVLATAKAVIVIAFPQGITVVTFRRGGKDYEVVIPPTYIYEGIRKVCRDILGRVLEGADRQIERASLPLKLLAARSGLGKYGRNNICYIEAMGSFHRLEAFYVNYPFTIDNWQKVEMMDTCTGCVLCVESCPTQTITMERFLIDAQKCLTHFNENVGEFPKWIDTQCHNALVGCMRCQSICPENREFIGITDKREVFSDEEAEIILRGIPKGDLPSDLDSKLKRLNMDEYYSVLSRNLGILLR